MSAALFAVHEGGANEEVEGMKIREIKIRNFRSIHEMTATLYAFTRIVGANNAGKSNVVDAIRCFYGRKFNPDCDFPFGINANDEESFVEVSFEGNGKDFSDILNVDGDVILLRVRFYFHKPSDESLDGKYVVVDDAGVPVENVKPLRKLPDTILGSLIYIPSMSKPTDELKLTGSSALNDLMGLAFSGQYANSAAYKEFASSVSKLTNQSKASENNDTCSLSQIEQLLSADLCQWGVKLNMEFKPLAVPDLIKSMLDIELIDDETGKVVDVSRFGSGFQRSLIFRLVKAAAEWKGSKETDGENDGFRIMLFEEPEAFLHPDQQYELALKLKDLSVHGMQVVCTSHSPIFVGCKSEDIPSIIRVEKKKGCTNCYQVDGDKWQSLLDANGQFPEELNVKEEENTAYLDEFRYALWMLGERASIFFAKQVLLVEGATEVALIDILRENGVLSLPTGTVVVNCLGKYNIHRFMALLREYKITCAVMYDDDSLKTDQKEKKKQAAWNRFVEDQAGRKPTVKTYPVKGDVESALGVEKFDGRDDVKPYHLMKLFHERRIDCEKLDAICRDIESLF